MRCSQRLLHPRHLIVEGNLGEKGEALGQGRVGVLDARQHVERVDIIDVLDSILEAFRHVDRRRAAADEIENRLGS